MSLSQALFLSTEDVQKETGHLDGILHGKKTRKKMRESAMKPRSSNM